MIHQHQFFESFHLGRQAVSLGECLSSECSCDKGRQGLFFALCWLKRCSVNKRRDTKRAVVIQASLWLMIIFMFLCMWPPEKL